MRSDGARKTSRDGKSKKRIEKRRDSRERSKMLRHTVYPYPKAVISGVQDVMEVPIEDENLD